MQQPTAPPWETRRNNWSRTRRINLHREGDFAHRCASSSRGLRSRSRLIYDDASVGECDAREPIVIHDECAARARLVREVALAYLAGARHGLALELAPRGIRVNVVAPGLTDTPMVRRIPGHIQTGLPDVPLAALVPPAEVAALAIHLLSDDARHVTGAVFSIDGGRTAG